MVLFLLLSKKLRKASRMKFYRCDFCEKEINEALVVLNGIVGISGGILLPERFHKKHFCSTICFEDWVLKYIPVIPKKEVV